MTVDPTDPETFEAEARGLLALFGLGALGLGGIVLRRRRAKLAAAKPAA